MTSLIKYFPLSLIIVFLLVSCENSNMRASNETQSIKLSLEQKGIFYLADSIFSISKKQELEERPLSWLKEYSSAVHTAIQEKYDWDNDSMDIRVYSRKNNSEYYVSSIKDGTKRVDEILPEHLENRFNGTHKCMKPGYYQNYYKTNYTFRCSDIYEEPGMPPILLEFCLPNPIAYN